MQYHSICKYQKSIKREVIWLDVLSHRSQPLPDFWKQPQKSVLEQGKKGIV